MILGALMGLGISREGLVRSLSSMKIDPFEIVLDEVVEQGMSGVRASVKVAEAEHTGHGRHLSTILRLIDESALSEPVKEQASTVFQRIGEAEAEVHGVDVEKIHFHEVGAMDSIVDIVGCCLALHELGVDAVSIRDLPQGHGTIECAHGTYPNPAPATLRLLEGFPLTSVDEPFELVTPTGAALLSQWRTTAAPPAGWRASASVYSFGRRTLNSRPNLLRATIYEAVESSESDCCLVLECNIDDSSPELIGCLFDRLMELGALDVFTVPVMMKKQRPGVLLTVLCDPADREPMLETLFHESSTFGVRERLSDRAVLVRSINQIETAYGPVRIKEGRWKGRVVSASPEMEDCIRLAREQGVVVKQVYQAAIAARYQEGNEG